ncbi:MAG: hypothetical protein JXA71_07095 [Chitinispirillaceae bacterium]|nr:hypothetical protein [Chitinispirillaceae bacterium]
MQKSFVKIMNTISEIENHVLKGLVLDEHGQWIPIADKKAVEEDFLAHLSAGKVLHEGRWVSFAEAKSAKAPTEIATTMMETATAAPDALPEAPGFASDPIEETRNGMNSPVAPLSDLEQTAFPPETKTVIIEPSHDTPLVSSEEVDPFSGYAPETGAFMVEHSEGDHAEPREDDPEPANRTTTSILLPTVSSWEQSARKGRLKILVFGGIGVALAGIGAILLLVFQIAR